MSSNKRIQFYKKAINNFIDMSTKDATASVSKEHGIIGLTRILIAMEKLGISDGDCRFLALPDFTFTRSPRRWGAGFPYGCIIRTSGSNEKIPFIPLDFHPNCCGVTLAKIPYFDEDINSLQKRFNEIMNSYNELSLDDFKRGNHFIGIYHHNNEYYVLIHGSLDLVKSNLYAHRSKNVQSYMKTLDILNAPFNFLYGETAEIYFQEYLEYERKTLFYRKAFIMDLFPNAQVIFNKTHEGFYNMNTILLGGYVSSTPFDCPIMLSAGTDLSLVNINNPSNIGGEKIYCSPHGGGYSLNEVIDAKKTSKEIDSDFILFFNNGSKMLSDNLLSLPYSYRTDTDKYWCDIYNMGSIKKKLKPVLNMKI